MHNTKIHTISCVLVSWIRYTGEDGNKVVHCLYCCSMRAVAGSQWTNSWKSRSVFLLASALARILSADAGGISRLLSKPFSSILVRSPLLSLSCFLKIFQDSERNLQDSVLQIRRQRFFSCKIAWNKWGREEREEMWMKFMREESKKWEEHKRVLVWFEAGHWPWKRMS